MCAPQVKPRVKIALLNPKSPDNVGAVLRASANHQVDSVVYTGQRYPTALARSNQNLNMSRAIGKNIPLDPIENVMDAATDGMQIVCVELVENAIALPVFEHPEHALYIFGPEDGSIDQHIIDQANAVVYMPTVGCMNLSATVNVLLYDRTAKRYQPQQDNNALIRASRDNNNLLVVKTSIQASAHK